MIQHVIWEKCICDLSGSVIKSWPISTSCDAPWTYNHVRLSDSVRRQFIEDYKFKTDLGCKQTVRRAQIWRFIKYTSVLKINTDNKQIESDVAKKLQGASDEIYRVCFVVNKWTLCCKSLREDNRKVGNAAQPF